MRRLLRISSAVVTMCGDVDRILRQSFSKQLYNPKHEDQVRLLKLRMWEQKYRVSLKYILDTLVPHYEKLGKRKTGRANSKGLGTTIAILTGPAAEEYLCERIAKDFPDNENVIDWKEKERQRCLALLDKEELIGRPRKILSYPTLSEYMKVYRKKVEKARRSTSKRETKLAKQPWRNNPWR